MRIYEDNYAYEIEQILDPATQVHTGWRYKMYRVRPMDELLYSGQAPTRAAAEEAGKRALAELITEQKGQSLQEKRAG
jgi:hypothetical protein